MRIIYLFGEFDEKIYSYFVKQQELEVICCLYYNHAGIMTQKITCIDTPSTDAVLGDQEKMKVWAHTLCFNKCYKIRPFTQEDQVFIMSFDKVFNPTDYASSGVYSIHKLEIKQHYILVEETSLVDFFKNVIFDDQNPFDIVKTTPESQIFLIPSVINITKEGRSNISNRERFKQTCKQLSSIHTFYPNAITILLEMSKEISPEYLFELSKRASCVVMYCNNDTLRFHAHVNPNKNASEIFCVYDIVRRLPKEYSHICKFGGRYWINKSSRIFEALPVFKTFYAEYAGQTIVEPVFYSIPKKYVSRFEETLIEMKKTFEGNEGSYGLGNEEMLWHYFASRIPYINPENFHIMGFTATKVFRYY